MFYCSPLLPPAKTLLDFPLLLSSILKSFRYQAGSKPKGYMKLQSWKRRSDTEECHLKSQTFTRSEAFSVPFHSLENCFSPLEHCSSNANSSALLNESNSDSNIKKFHLRANEGKSECQYMSTVVLFAKRGIKKTEIYFSHMIWYAQ